MFTFTLFVFVISGLALLLGIFFPKQTLFWGQKKTRSKVILTYLPIMLLAFSANTATSGIGLSEKIANIEAEINQVEQDYEQKGTSEVEANSKEESNSESLETMQVDFIDVGQADAALLQYEDKDEEYNVLIDTGDWNGNETIEHLEQENVNNVDLIALSHEHSDHLGQADKVMDAVDVTEVWLPGNEADSDVYERVIDGMEENNVDYNEPRAGEEYEIGPLDIEVVSPKELTGDLNDDSIVMNVTYGDISFLFTGDAEQNAESLMLENDSDLSADILKVGHHGSHTSNTEDFIREVEPDTAIISVGENNSYDHPSDEVISRLQNYGADTYITKDDGTITIETDGVDYSVQ